MVLFNLLLQKLYLLVQSSQSSLQILVLPHQSSSFTGQLVDLTHQLPLLILHPLILIHQIPNLLRHPCILSNRSLQFYITLSLFQRIIIRNPIQLKLRPLQLIIQPQFQLRQFIDSLPLSHELLLQTLCVFTHRL